MQPLFVMVFTLIIPELSFTHTLPIEHYFNSSVECRETAKHAHDLAPLAVQMHLEEMGWNGGRTPKWFTLSSCVDVVNGTQR